MDIRSYIDDLKEENLLVNFDDVSFDVSNIAYDSKKVSKGTLFVCKGAAFKKQYLKEAIEKGACCYVSEDCHDVNIPQIRVGDIRKAMAVIAGRFYDHPDRKLTLIGITGTKGKTTTAYYIKAILDTFLLNSGKKPAGILSGIFNYYGEDYEESSLTTPETFELFEKLSEASENGLEYLVMEVSSQALKYHRTYGLRFNFAGYLNLDEDHISPGEHSDFEDYKASKLLLFRACDVAVLNKDSEHYGDFLNESVDAKKVISFSSKGRDADYRACDINAKNGVLEFNIVYHDASKGTDEPVHKSNFKILSSGEFNIDNALLATSIGSELNVPYEDMKKALYNVKVPGRMEVVKSKGGRTAIVDFAHNKLSFIKLFEAVKKEYPDKRIAIVFGTPGGKAYDRRALMGMIAAKNADKVYITEDDPYKEKVEDICEEIRAEAVKYSDNIVVVLNRQDAIKRAAEETDAGWIILIVGKGIENSIKRKEGWVPMEPDNKCIERVFCEIESCKR